MKMNNFVENHNLWIQGYHDNTKIINPVLGEDYQVHYQYEFKGKLYNNLKELTKAGGAYQYIQLSEFKRLYR